GPPPPTRCVLTTDSPDPAVLTLRPPRGSSLFPYTTLFRSPPASASCTIDRTLMCCMALDNGPMSVSGSNGSPTLSALEVGDPLEDRKSTRLNSSHVKISYAVFCLKKKTLPRPPHDRAAIGR